MPAPLPPPIPKKDNKIDANEAQEIGDFLVAFAGQVQDANRRLRRQSIQSDDLSIGLGFAEYKNAQVSYDMDINVAKEGVKKSRSVSITTEVEGIRPPDATRLAPYSVLYGIFIPSEQVRPAIEQTLLLKGIGVQGGISPIFSVSPGRFWIRPHGSGLHFVITFPDITNISADTAIVEEVKSLDRLDDLLEPFFAFLEDKLKKINGV